MSPPPTSTRVVSLVAGPHTDGATHATHWLDAVIVLVLGAALFFLAHRVDVRAPHLDENSAWEVDERRGIQGLERVRTITPVEVGLLLSPQAAILTAIAAFVDRGLIAPHEPGFNPIDSLAEPQNALESAVLVQLTQTGDQSVSMAHLLADPAIMRALDDLRSSVRAQNLVRGLSPTVVGLVNLAGLAVFLGIAVGLMTWHGWISLALSPTKIGGIPLLISTVSAFCDRQWVTPDVSSALSYARYEYRSGHLQHSPHGGGYRETGVSLFGASAFEHVWAPERRSDPGTRGSVCAARRRPVHAAHEALARERLTVRAQAHPPVTHVIRPRLTHHSLQA